MASPSLTSRPEWQALVAHFEQVKSAQLRDLFESDSARAERFSLEAAGLLLDGERFAMLQHIADLTHEGGTWCVP